jgi:hypothetical protein
MIPQGTPAGAVVAKIEQRPVRRAAATEQNKIADGGKRLPGGVMSPEAAGDLEFLLGIEYAPSRLKVIERALHDACARRRKK